MAARGTRFKGSLSTKEGGLALPNGVEIRSAKAVIQAVGGVIQPTGNPVLIPALGAGLAAVYMTGTMFYKHAGAATTVGGGFFNLRLNGGNGAFAPNIALVGVFDGLTADKVVRLVDRTDQPTLLPNMAVTLGSSGTPTGAITVTDNAAYVVITVVYAVVKVDK